MTTTIATVLDLENEQVAYLRGVRTRENLAVALKFTDEATPAWKARLAPVAKGRIKFMLDGSLRFFPPPGARAKPAPLDAKIAKMSANKLRLSYHSFGVEQAFEVKRQVWRDDSQVVSLPTLAGRLKKAGRLGKQ